MQISSQKMIIILKKQTILDKDVFVYIFDIYVKCSKLLQILRCQQKIHKWEMKH